MSYKVEGNVKCKFIQPVNKNLLGNEARVIDLSVCLFN